MSTGFEVTDCELQFAIHLHCFAEHFLLLFIKFTDQFFIAYRSFNIVLEYCFTLILFSIGKALHLFTTIFFLYLTFNGKMITVIDHCSKICLLWFLPVSAVYSEDFFSCYIDVHLLVGVAFHGNISRSNNSQPTAKVTLCKCLFYVVYSLGQESMYQESVY